MRSERQLRVRLLSQDHAAELALDARHGDIIVGLETHHHHRRGVGRACQTETVFVFHAHAIDAIDFLRTRKRGIRLDLVEQRDRAEKWSIVAAKIDTLIAESETFIELARERRSALITAAVTGQIDVREAA